MKKLSICIPTYNERQNIEILIQKIIEIFHNIPFDYEIIVIDDNSPDGTGKIVTNLAKRYKNIRYVHRKQKNGLAQAYIEGFRNASGELIITMDADLSHNPDSIPDFLKASSAYQIVIGSRFLKNGGIFNRTKLRNLITLVANILAKRFLNVTTTDSTSGYRLYHREVLEKIVPKLTCHGFPFQVEILQKANYFNYTIGQIPYSFPRIHIDVK